MIFCMKLGFALLEVGSIRAKNTSNILLKNIVDTVTGAIIYYAIGYGLQFEQRGGVIGQSSFAAYGFSQPKQYLKLLFYYGFCATSTTIVSGALAERIYVDTYLLYAVLMTGIINPIAAGWAWGGGWLQVLGFNDFSGSGIVHLVGGTTALWGTFVCGPRIGMFGNHNIKSRSQQGGGRTQRNGGNLSQKSPYPQLSLYKNLTALSQTGVNPQHQLPSSAVTQPSRSDYSTISPHNNNHHDHQHLHTSSEYSTIYRHQHNDNIQEKFENSQRLPMAIRVHIFKRENPEFEPLDSMSIIDLIKLYDQNFDMKIQSNSMNAIVQGVFILFVTWLFFNSASGFTIVNRSPMNLPQKIVMNTILSGSMGAITVYLLKDLLMRKASCPSTYQITDICNGLLAGLVSITAPCNNVAHWNAIAIGFIGGIVYILACIFMIKFKIDDPVEASQVHGFCGAWGVLAVGIFDIDKGLITGSYYQLGIQTLGMVVLFLWATVLSIGYFYIMKKLNRLRVDPIFEIIGLDAIMHEESEKFNHISAHSIRVAEFKKAINMQMDQKRIKRL